MRNCIYYLTYDGFYSYTSGIGTQTRTFLSGITRYSHHLTETYGETDIRLIVPRYDCTVKGFDHSHLEYAGGLVSRLGGTVQQCESVLDKEDMGFWSVGNWDVMCSSAAALVLAERSHYERVLVLAVDPPFLHVPRHIELGRRGSGGKINSVILLYTSSYIHDQANLSFEKLGWEYSGLASARIFDNVYIGAFCEYMREHFVSFYGADPASFVPYASSLDLDHRDFKKLRDEEVLSILARYEIPVDQDVILSFGRDAWVKGFDILLGALGSFHRKALHLVLVASACDTRVADYERMINDLSISCTVVRAFSRDLPMALCQHRRCRIVVCPSRSEPFSNIPLEVGLWARTGGPVVLASKIGGFPEQIEDGASGFLFGVESQEDLLRHIELILALPEERLAGIREAAYGKVVRERDFCRNFNLLLSSLWSE